MTRLPFHRKPLLWHSVTANASINGIVTASVSVEYLSGSPQRLESQDYNLQLIPGQSVLLVVDFVAKSDIFLSSVQAKGMYMELEGAINWVMPETYPPRLALRGIITSITGFTNTTGIALPIGIGAFPFESIVIGIIVGIVVLGLIRRRPSVRRYVPSDAGVGHEGQTFGCGDLCSRRPQAGK